jgi:peptidoglycan hydrolase-like protein with peptidoglycan-binding domain
MRQEVRRWLLRAGAVGAVGAAIAAGQGAAGASATRPTQVTAAAAAAYKPPGKPLYFGEKGAAVRSVQRRLAQLHYYLGKIDGNYGQNTIEAAWAFREVQGLPMNDTTGAQPINRAFEKALVHPKQPYVLIKHPPATRIEVNLKHQVLVLYKKGKVALITHVSSGGGYYFCNPPPPKSDGSCSYAVTPDGNFYAYSFQSGWITVPLGTMYNPIWVDPAAGVAIHGDIPVPWDPVSHGCIRVWIDIANKLHTMINIGGKHPTPVYVRGKAPYILGPG